MITWLQSRIKRKVLSDEEKFKVTREVENGKKRQLICIGNLVS